jgi:hypothetical protein
MARCFCAWLDVPYQTAPLAPPQQASVRSSGISLLWLLCEVKRFQTRNWKNWQGVRRAPPDLTTVVSYDSVPTDRAGESILTPIVTHPLSLLDMEALLQHLP